MPHLANFIIFPFLWNQHWVQESIRAWLWLPLVMVHYLSRILDEKRFEPTTLQSRQSSSLSTRRDWSPEKWLMGEPLGQKNSLEKENKNLYFRWWGRILFAFKYFSVCSFWKLKLGELKDVFDYQVLLVLLKINVN